MTAPTMRATGALFSPCGTYRYSLDRIWNPHLGRCTFVCFNPSTADALVDDPTIRRCIGFADAWGYGALSIVNLFAFRSTDPKGLRSTTDPVGPMNDATIRFEILRSDRLVFAWGALATGHSARTLAVERMLWDARLSDGCVTIGGKTKDGHPRHPLYLKADSPALDWATRDERPSNNRTGRIPRYHYALSSGPTT